jgi:Na+/melibiose symporter-like transporter
MTTATTLQTPPPAPPRAPGQERRDLAVERRAAGIGRWVPLLVMGLAVVIIVLDTTLLNVSLGTIVRDLRTNIRSLQWVITAYSLTLAALTITGGRLGDLFGRRRMFVVGAGIFAVGSLLASLAHSVGMLVVGESIIEGIGAALMMPATSSLLVANYRGARPRHCARRVGRDGGCRLSDRADRRRMADHALQLAVGLPHQRRRRRRSRRRIADHP